MRVKEGLELVRSREGRRWVWRIARQRLYSRRESTCIRRDLSLPYSPPPAKIAVDVRQLRPDDDLSLVADDPTLDRDLAALRATQRWLLSSDLPTPWVAVDRADGKVCFMIWFLTARDNARIKARWGNWLPELKPDEVLVEGPYTADSHRGLGLMADAGTVALDRALEQAGDTGVRYGLGFIGTSNTSSLKAGDKAGWYPFMRREEKWILFRRRVRFLPLADATE